MEAWAGPGQQLIVGGRDITPRYVHKANGEVEWWGTGFLPQRHSSASRDQHITITTLCR